MSVWGVSMFRDEADVAYHSIMHMAEEGLDGIIVADNLSTDGTRAELDRAAADVAGFCQVIVDVDDEPGYYQSVKMTNLAKRAAACGADWIVPFDADELWYARDHIGWLLPKLPETVMVATATLFNHFGSSIDPPGNNPFVTMGWRQKDPGALPKAAFRWREGARILQGNHGVVYDDLPTYGSLPALELRHFPFRTWPQFRRKAANGAAAYAATDLPLTEGAHWRQYGAILDQEDGDAKLESVYRRWFWHLAPVEAGMVYDPAPFRRWTRGQDTEPAPPADKE